MDVDNATMIDYIGGNSTSDDGDAGRPFWNQNASATFYFYLVLWLLPAVVSFIYCWGFSSSYRQSRVYCWHRLLECSWTPTRYLGRVEERANEARRARRLQRKQKRMAAETAMREQLAKFTMRLRNEDIFEDEDMDSYLRTLKEKQVPEVSSADDGDDGNKDDGNDGNKESAMPTADVHVEGSHRPENDTFAGGADEKAAGSDTVFDNGSDDLETDGELVDDDETGIDETNEFDDFDTTGHDKDIETANDETTDLVAPLPMVDDENGTICVPCGGYRLGFIPNDETESGDHSVSSSENAVPPTPPTPSFLTVANVPTEKIRRAPNGCSICLCEFEAGEPVTWACDKACTHIFHFDCVLHWFESVGKKQRRRRQTSIDQWKCPCCRQTFADRTGMAVRRPFDHVDGILQAAESVEGSSRRNDESIRTVDGVQVEETNDHSSAIDETADHTIDLESGIMPPHVAHSTSENR